MHLRHIPLMGLLAIGVALAGPTTATPVTDPGFAFVDVNGDGLYDTGSGDIALPNFAALAATGTFDTQVSQAGYTAPCRRASLIIPASTPVTVSQALTLRAGRQLVIHSNITAESLNLAARSTVNLTGATIQYAQAMTVQTYRDVLLDGTIIGGSNAGSTFNVVAWGNVTNANQTGAAPSTMISANGAVAISASGSVDLVNAIVSSWDSNVKIAAGATDATDSGCSTQTIGTQCECGGGGDEDTNSSSNITLTGASITAGGAISITAGKLAHSWCCTTNAKSGNAIHVNCGDGGGGSGSGWWTPGTTGNIDLSSSQMSAADTVSISAIGTRYSTGCSWWWSCAKTINCGGGGDSHHGGYTVVDGDVKILGANISGTQVTVTADGTVDGSADSQGTVCSLTGNAVSVSGDESVTVTAASLVANNGDIVLNSQYGDVSANTASITACAGAFDIAAGGNIALANANIMAATATFIANGGNIDGTGINILLTGAALPVCGPAGVTVTGFAYTN